MRKIREIANNCEKATFMIEKKFFGALTLKENLELKIHLANCEPCRIFQRQSTMIDKLAGNILFSNNKEEIKLDERFKKILQNSIDENFAKSNK